MFGLTSKVSAIVSGVGTALLVTAIAYGLHSWSVSSLNRAHEKALQAQKTSLIKECFYDKSITEGIDNAIYDNHSLIDTILSDRLRSDAPTCIAVTSDSGGPTKAATGKDVHRDVGRALGVSRAELYKLTAEADKVRADLIECRAFIEQTWRAKGQPIKAPVSKPHDDSVTSSPARFPPLFSFVPRGNR